jgi:hypothetical protein
MTVAFPFHMIGVALWLVLGIGALVGALLGTFIGLSAGRPHAGEVARLTRSAPSPATKAARKAA